MTVVDNMTFEIKPHDKDLLTIRNENYEVYIHRTFVVVRRFTEPRKIIWCYTLGNVEIEKV